MNHNNFKHLHLHLHKVNSRPSIPEETHQTMPSPNYKRRRQQSRSSTLSPQSDHKSPSIHSNSSTPRIQRISSGSENASPPFFRSYSQPLPSQTQLVFTDSLRFRPLRLSIHIAVRNHLMIPIQTNSLLTQTDTLGEEYLISRKYQMNLSTFKTNDYHLTTPEPIQLLDKIKSETPHSHNKPQISTNKKNKHFVKVQIATEFIKRTQKKSRLFKQPQSIKLSPTDLQLQTQSSPSQSQSQEQSQEELTTMPKISFNLFHSEIQQPSCAARKQITPVVLRSNLFRRIQTYIYNDQQDTEVSTSPGSSVQIKQELERKRRIQIRLFGFSVVLFIFLLFFIFVLSYVKIKIRSQYDR